MFRLYRLLHQIPSILPSIDSIGRQISPMMKLISFSDIPSDNALSPPAISATSARDQVGYLEIPRNLILCGIWSCWGCVLGIALRIVLPFLQMIRDVIVTAIGLLELFQLLCFLKL